MTNHKQFIRIHLHPIVFVLFIISFFTGTFVQLFIIMAIVLIHEMGHFFIATLFKWRVRRIMLWIFGGVMETDEYGSRPLYEELLVIIAGPFQHIFIYLCYYFLSHYQLLPVSVLEMVFFYNTLILLFNLLPIYPLDGGKVLSLLLSLVLPYRKAYVTSIVFSLTVCVCFLFSQFFIFPFVLTTFLLLMFLFLENYTEWKQRYYIFMRFLLHRYHGDIAINGVRYIEVPSNSTLMDVFTRFHRSKKHHIYVTYPSNRRLTLDENDCLRYYFHEKHYHKTIGEIAKMAA